MPSSAKIQLDFQALNLESIISALKEVNTLSGKIELPKNIVKQINDLTIAVEAMKASTSTIAKSKLDTKTFNEFAKQFRDINQRVSTLEDAMSKLGKGQDISGIVGNLNTIKDTAKEAASAITSVNNSLSEKPNQQKSKSNINTLKEELSVLKEVRELRESKSITGSIPSSKIDKMQSKTVLKNLREQIETVRELQQDLADLREEKAPAIDIKPVVEQINSIIYTLDQLKERYEKLNGEDSLQLELVYPDFKGSSSIDDMIEEARDDFGRFNKELSNEITGLNEKIQNLLKSANKAKEQLQTQDTKYSKQGKQQITIPLHVRANEDENLKKEIDTVLEEVQSSIKPLEVRVALVSGYKTKKAQELASQLSENLANINDKEVRDKISELIERLNKQFGDKLHFDIEVEGAQKAKQVILDLVTDLQSEMTKALPPLSIDAKFSKDSLDTLSKQLNEIDFQPIKLTTRKVASGEDSKDGKKLEKEYKPLDVIRQAIEKITEATNAKTDAFTNEVKTVEEGSSKEVEYLTYLLQKFVDIKSVLSDISSLAIKLNDTKIEFDAENLQRMVSASELMLSTIRENSSATNQSETSSAPSIPSSVSEVKEELAVAEQLTNEYKEQQKAQEGTVDELERGFQIIKKNLDKYGNFNLSRKKDKEWLSFWTDQYVRYQQSGGQRPITDLSDNKIALGKIQKEYQKQISKFVDEEPISFSDTGDKELVQDLKGAEKELNTFYKMLVSVPEKFENIRDDFDSKVRNGLLSGVDAAKELNKQMSLYKLHLKETEENYKKQSESFEERFINEGYDNTKLSKLLDDIEEAKSKLHQEYDATGGSKDAEGLVTIYNNLDKLSEQITDTLKKNATISNDITSEAKNEVVQTQEVSKFVGKTNEELQQCLANEEKWLAKCKEGSEAYNRRKANIEEINALLSASTPLDNNNLSSESIRFVQEQNDLQKELKETEQQAKKASIAIKEIRVWLKDENTDAIINELVPSKYANLVNGKVFQNRNDMENTMMALSRGSKFALEHGLAAPKDLTDAIKKIETLEDYNQLLEKKNQLEKRSNKTPVSSKIDSIKDESKAIDQQTVKIEENTKAQRENQAEKSNADSKVNLTNEMTKTGSDSIDGLTEGIKAKEQQYFDTMEGVMQEGVNIARKAIGAESPARKYIKVSEDAVDGLIVGLKNKEEEYFAAIREMMQKATSIIQEETANIGTNIKFGEGLEKATKYLQELSKALNTLGGSKSDKKINKLQENIQKLQSVFSTFKGRKNNLLTQIETILQKGNELKSLADVLKSSQKSIDSATKAINRKQQESQAKTTASENLSKYEDDIRKGLQDIISKNQWTALSSQMEPYKDGLIHITALIKDLDGQYKELVYTTENGKIFNSESIKDTDISINKKAQAYEKYQQMLERLNIGAEAIGEVTPESDNWQRLVDLMKEFGIEVEDAVRIIRQVDEVGHESFQVFDALGNKKTIGVSSKDFLAIKETVNDSSKAIKEYNDLIQSLAKYSKKNFDLTNLEAERLLSTLNKFPSAWEKVQSGISAGSISNNEISKLNESYKSLLDDFNKEWFSEKQQPKIKPDYLSQYKGLKEELNSIITVMKNSPEFPSHDSINKLSSFISEARQFYKVQDQINIKMTDSGTVDKLLGKIGDNLVRNSSMTRELSNDFKNLRDRIKAMRDATTGMLPTDEFNKFNIEFQELVRIMKETGQTGLGFFDLVGQKIKGISASLIAQYLSLQDWIRYFRTAFETIHQLDTALVDLKKTTTMSNSELEDFYHNSSRIAKQMGVSSQEIISQASAWSRLGYSSKEAAESMAELSSQFAKISPGTSVEDATDYLVSTMKAFNIDVTNVESDIMDSINRIGNTMATSNQEVGEMLKRSSAAMAAANNSLAETIALESAAVQITRNAETTGINSAA